MTKKDYIKFADLVASWKFKGYLTQAIDPINTSGVSGFGNIISDLSSLFQKDNSRFQANKFYNYIAEKVEKANKE